MTLGGFAVGDRVRIGSGRRVWKIDSFWTGALLARGSREPMALLLPTEPGCYSKASARLGRLTTVEPAEAQS